MIICFEGHARQEIWATEIICGQFGLLVSIWSRTRKMTRVLPYRETRMQTFIY